MTVSMLIKIENTISKPAQQDRVSLQHGLGLRAPPALHKAPPVVHKAPPVVYKPQADDHLLQNVQHLLRLAKHQRLVALGSPV